MAMDVGGAKGGVKADINVTPLVDVMLVLLIIMMVVAPMINQGASITLPRAANSTPKPDTSDQVVVSVDSNGQYYVNAVGPIPKEEVPRRLTDLFDQTGSKVVFLKGDQDAAYGAIMDLMDALRRAQIDSVALITDRPSGATAGGN
jgi:biopolymer transport protein ExbD